MFRMQNAAMALAPQAQLSPHYCFEFTYGGCFCTFSCGYYSGCNWNYHSYIPCVAYTTRTVIEQVACQAATQPVPGGQMPGGDPLQELQALRRQLEVTLAGLEAQEKTMRQQQDAAGGQQPGAGAAQHGKP